MNNFIKKNWCNFKNIILIICATILYSCNNNVKQETSDEVNGGCGYINALQGDISIFSSIDSTQYILTIITKELTTMKMGNFSIMSKNMQLEDNLSNKVFLLDFDTKEKRYDKITKDMEGYVFPCSDILSNSHIPDSLILTKGEVNISVTEKQDKRQRIYILQITDAEFSKGDKIKVVKNFKSKKLLFISGNPG